MSVNKVVYGGTTLIDLSHDTLTADKLLSGVTGHDKAGDGVTGTIPSLGAQTITPGTSDQIIAAGQFLSGEQTIKGDANLMPENIAQGVRIFGVEGTFSGGAIKGATGTVSVAQWASSVTVSGLDFDPKAVYFVMKPSYYFAADVDGLVACVPSGNYTHSQGSFTIQLSLVTSEKTATWYAIGQ